MPEKEDATARPHDEKSEKKGETLKPCTTSYSAETSRPDEDEEACDEGVQ